MIDEVVCGGMGGGIKVAEKDGLASKRGGGTGGGVGAAADGTKEGKGVHGWAVGDAVVAPTEEAKSLYQSVTVRKREEGSVSGCEVMRESRSWWRDVGQMM